MAYVVVRDGRGRADEGVGGRREPFLEGRLLRRGDLLWVPADLMGGDVVLEWVPGVFLGLDVDEDVIEVALRDGSRAILSTRVGLRRRGGPL
jgi:hypothetical protein